MTFRVVLFGLGHAGRTLHLPALRRLPDVEVVAVCDTDPHRLPDGDAAFIDAGAALEVPSDGAIVATPPGTHEALAVRVLDAGRHLYVEKPLADSLAGVDAVAAAVQRADRTVQVGFAYRYHPLWQRLQRAVTAGALRTPFSARAVFDASDGAGWAHPMVEVGLHHVDLLGSLVDHPVPVAVETAGQYELVVRWPDGSELRGRYGPGPGRDRAEVEFQSNTVTIDRRSGVRLRGVGIRRGLPVPSLVRARPGRTGWERSFERALAAFVAAARHGRAATPGLADGRRAVAVGVAVLEALETGRSVVPCP